MQISPDLKIEIRPIPNKKGIREFSDTLEYFSQAHIICPLVDPETRKFKTGLSEEDVKFLKDKGFPYNLDDTYFGNVPHEFWESQTVKIELTSNPIFLFPGKNDIDFIKYKYILESKFVYSSEAEMLAGDKHEATHFIYNEEKEIALKATKIEEKNNLINKIGKLSKQRKKELILIILNENTDNKDDDYLTVRFEDILDNKTYTEELSMLLSQKAEEISLTSDIKKAVQKNILKRTKEGIFYFDNNLGYTEKDVFELFSKPENQELYLNIKTQIN